MFNLLPIYVHTFGSTFVLTVLKLSLTLGEYNEIVLLFEGVILFTMSQNNKPTLIFINNFEVSPHNFEARVNHSLSCCPLNIL